MSPYPHRLPFMQTLYRSITRLGYEPLNLGDTPKQPIDGLALAEQLKANTNTLKAVALDPETGHVNYQALATSEIYQTCRNISIMLQRFDPHQLTTREEKLAFWINLYNILMIDAVIHYRIQKNISEVRGIFDKTGYIIGGYFFSLNDIEQGILRANAGHPYIPGPQFHTNDPRQAFMLDELDFRIHFALVCGAQSCPPVNFYDAEKIDHQLDLAAKNFINNSLDVERQNQTIRTSKILQWYSSDFGAAATFRLLGGNAAPILHTITPYILDESLLIYINENMRNIKMTFAPYDWSLNHV